MSQFFNVFRHLLPRGQAWKLTADKALRRFVLGLSQWPQEWRDYADLVYLDGFAATARDLDEWEAEFGVEEAATEDERRATIDAEWKRVGGMDPANFQDTLQAAGFDLYLHEWWESGPPYVARNPLNYTELPIIGSVQASALPTQPQASALATQPQANRFLANEPGYWASLDLTQGAPPPIPNDPSKWPYFIYVGREEFGERIHIQAAHRARVERLIESNKRATNWVTTFIDWDEIPEDIANNLIVLDSLYGVELGDGGAVTAWRNQGTGGSDYDATAPADGPALIQYDRDFGGRPALEFIASDGRDHSLTAATAALMKFLHDGTGCTVYVVGHADATSGDRAFVSTVVTPAEAGARLEVQAGSLDLHVRVRNSSTQSVVQADIDTPINPGVPFVAAFRYEDGATPKELDGYLDSSTAALSVDGSFAPSSANAEAALQIGKLPNGASILDGRIACIIVDNTRHDDARFANTVAWLQERFRTLPSFVKKNLVVYDSDIVSTLDANGKVSFQRNLGRGGSTYDRYQGTEANRPAHRLGETYNNPATSQNYGGRHSIVADSNDHLEASNLSSWAFLHNGNDHVAYGVFEVPAVADGPAILMTTRWSSPGVYGFRMAGTSGDDSVLQWSLFDASTSRQVEAPGPYLDGEVVQTTYCYDSSATSAEMQLRVNGTLEDTTDFDLAPSTSDPGDVVFMDGGQFSEASLILDDAIPTAGKRSQIEQWQANRSGVTLVFSPYATPPEIVGADLQTWVSPWQALTVTSSPDIDAIPEQSSYGRTVAQSVAARKPHVAGTNNNIADFDGSDDGLDVASGSGFPAHKSHSIWFLANLRETADAQLLGSPNIELYCDAVLDKLGFKDAAGYTSFATGTAALGWRVVEFALDNDAGLAQLYVDGVLTDTVSYSGLAMVSHTLGIEHTYSSAYAADMQLAEYALISRATGHPTGVLTSAERQAMQLYMAETASAKYAITL